MRRSATQFLVYFIPNAGNAFIDSNRLNHHPHESGSNDRGDRDEWFRRSCRPQGGEPTVDVEAIRVVRNRQHGTLTIESQLLNAVIADGGDPIP